MKKLIIVLSFVYLTGCSTIASIWPKPHDPVMFDHSVSIKVKMDQINCSNRDWGDLIDRVHHLKVYTELRNYPQSKAIGQLEEALTKAKSSSNEKFCDSILKLNKTRIDVVQDAWKGR